MILRHHLNRCASPRRRGYLRCRLVTDRHSSADRNGAAAQGKGAIGMPAPGTGGIAEMTLIFIGFPPSEDMGASAAHGGCAPFICKFAKLSRNREKNGRKKNGAGAKGLATWTGRAASTCGKASRDGPWRTARRPPGFWRTCLEGFPGIFVQKSPWPPHRRSP
jgi:hypothetical protein